MQKEYWNNTAEKANFDLPLDANKFMDLVDKNSVIVDVGCGYGRTMANLYAIGYKRIIGIDTSDRMVARGKKTYPYLDIRLQKSKIIAVKENTADVVILFGVLSCNYVKKEQEIILEEIKRILKPNGLLFVCDYLVSKDLRNSLQYMKFEEKYSNYGTFETNDGLILKHYSELEIENLFSDFEIMNFNKNKLKNENGSYSSVFNLVCKSNSIDK